jgi:hypothetical protein
VRPARRAPVRAPAQVGDNEEVVDEKMWDAEDDAAQGEGEERKEKYDDRAVQVGGGGVPWLGRHCCCRG